MFVSAQKIRSMIVDCNAEQLDFEALGKHRITPSFDRDDHLYQSDHALDLSRQKQAGSSMRRLWTRSAAVLTNASRNDAFAE